MRSKLFLLVCTSHLHTDVNGRIDFQRHYELSTEIDAFYAMTQLGEKSTKHAKVLMCGECVRGKESQIHELFANRTHFYMDKDKGVLDELYHWIQDEIAGSYRWSDFQVTSEIQEVFAVRASMKESCNFDALVANAKSVRAIGISNSEMTIKINPEAVQNCIMNGGTFEIVFLDPQGKFTKLREEEEGLRPGKIKNITNVNIDCALDAKYSLGEWKDNYKIYLYDKQPRMNMIFVDNYLFLQYYANNIPGLLNPSFFIEKQKISPIYDFCEKAYTYLKKDAKELSDYELS